MMFPLSGLLFFWDVVRLLWDRVFTRREIIECPCMYCADDTVRVAAGWE